MGMGHWALGMGVGEAEEAEEVGETMEYGLWTMD